MTTAVELTRRRC